MLRLLSLLFALLAAPVAAHFSEGTQIREIVIQQDEGGTSIWVRAPMPLLFADTIEEARANRSELASAYLLLERTGAGIRYRFLMDALAADATAFETRLANSLEITRNGSAVELELTGYRVSARRPSTRFDTAAAATAALAEPSTGLDPVFSEAIVEYELYLPQGQGTLHLRSPLPIIELPDGVGIDNHITRDTGTRTITITRPGQLDAETAFPRHVAEVVAAFLWLGMTHIATGLDHVFLIICIALGIGWSHKLFWVITGFTVGHSVTLSLGAFGVVPQVSWFIPLVEIAIAGSVVLAAWTAWRGRSSQLGMAAGLAVGVGLIHGFGFASFLSDSLSANAASFLPALAGFNIGLELGQIVLVLITIAVVTGMAAIGPRTQAVARTAALAGIALVAGYWTLERVASLALA